jgi:hypothetical protein
MGSSLKLFRVAYIFPRREDPANETCCICLETYHNNHRAVRVQFKGCMHIFGQECPDGWFVSDSENSNSCPICRKEWYSRSYDKSSGLASNMSRLLASVSRRSDRVHRNLAARIEPKYNPLDIIRSRTPELRGAYLAEISQLLSVLEESSFGVNDVPGNTHERSVIARCESDCFSKVSGLKDTA